MYCIKCGKENTEIAKFCTGCGAQINHNDGEVQSSSQFDPLSNAMGNVVVPQSKKRNHTAVIAVLTVVLLFGIGLVVFFVNKGAEQTESSTEISQQQGVPITEEADIANEVIDEESLVQITKTYLDILFRLYYVTQDFSGEPDSVSALLIGMIGDAIKDKKDLEDLLYKVAQMKQYKSQVVSTTGLVLEVSIQELINAYTSWIAYLRTVDENSVEINEFQYQLANFHATNKQTFMKLYEGTSLYPFLFINLGEEGEADNTWNISEDSKTEIVSEIDRLFADVFVRDEKSYEETETRNVIVLIVKALREFFVPAN